MSLFNLQRFWILLPHFPIYSRLIFPLPIPFMIFSVDFSINRSFDCIYSNKVLYHLSKADLRHSFTLQREHLNEAGLLMHSFWRGDSEETEQGLRFVYYTIDSLTEMIGPGFTVVETNRYAEMEDDDSLYVVLRKTSDK